MVDAREFRAALGRFASGVTVVTTRDSRGEPHGLTVSAFCSLSLEPPLVLVCIQRASPTHQALEESRAFIVNILGARQEEVSRQFASRLADRFDGVPHRAGIDGIPLLEGAVVNLECRLRESHAGGDHSIFVGQVEGVTLSDEPPLLYYRGAYAKLS